MVGSYGIESAGQWSFLKPGGARRALSDAAATSESREGQATEQLPLSFHRGPSRPLAARTAAMVRGIWTLGRQAGLELRWRARGKAGGAATLGTNKKTERVRPAFLAVD